ncbi:hypothetical protein [Roseomonas sp. KE2513]|uniref:hypothetical protein n=1 Tax=Roseomonas sp. KE2513 TaxID=2479202 RepID=UPI0018DFA226|nr:hypothetical protein [Roseomonas sp. KE2513]
MGGEEKLSFDTKAGLMAVFAGTGVTETLAAVMAGIGMRAEPSYGGKWVMAL